MKVGGRLRALTMAGMVAFGIGGLLLHIKIHPLMNDGELVARNLVPLLGAACTIVLIPLLFSTGRHSHWAQMLNLGTVVAGVAGMTKLMFEQADGEYGLFWFFVGGTLADSLILLGKGLLGQMMFEVDYDRLAKGGWKDRGGGAPWWRFMHLPFSSAHSAMRLCAVLSLALIGLGGGLLHFKIHIPFDPDEGILGTYLVPYVSMPFTVFAVPLLFAIRKSAWAQLINGMTAIVGMVVMTHFMIHRAGGEYSLGWLLLGGTLADSFLLAGKWSVGQMMFEADLDRLAKRDWDAVGRRPKWWRFQRLGWWLIHLALIALVYAVGAWIF